MISQPLVTPADLDPLVGLTGDARCVMLGEASHGTHEYYIWRAAITRRLIEEKGFRIIVVEGDWPDCYRVNRYIKGLDFQTQTATGVLAGFRRWPTWMWGNWEIGALLSWLKAYNAGRPPGQLVGFYGLDVYSLWDSLGVMHEYLSRFDPAGAEAVRDAIRCFEPYGDDGQQYALAQHLSDDSCRKDLIRLLAQVRKHTIMYDHDPEAALNIEQNAYVAVNAEQYYAEMMRFGNNTWNLRDIHMFDTLDRLLRFHGPEAKAVVWAHNTHIGDARYTAMRSQGMLNIGQLARQHFGEGNVRLIGFGSYEGSVMAAARWDAPMTEMPVPKARPGSIEEYLHQKSGQDVLLVFDEKDKGPSQIWGQKMPHRAIGVVYNPNNDHFANYVPTEMASRYDAFIYLDQTSALHPLHLHPEPSRVPETYPFTF